MKTYSLTDLSNKSGEVIEAAYSGPVDITSRGKRKFVLLTADWYDHLRQSTNKQRAFRTDALDEDDRELFLSGLDAIVAQGNDSNE